jgi:hypothetical protein
VNRRDQNVVVGVIGWTVAAWMAYFVLLTWLA